ncbi:MAG: DUF11 domain-containing protein, partial [Caldilineae bacterium]
MCHSKRFPLCKAMAFCLKAGTIFLTGLVLFIILWGGVPALALPPGLQEYFVLGNEYHIYRMLRSTGVGLPALGAGSQRYMASIVDITITADNQIVYYDHWEDGYEADILNPTQTGALTGTLVFGDGDPANGNAGDYTGRPNDILLAGDTLSLSSRNNITTTGAITGYVPIDPRQASDVRFDGGDRIVSTGGPVGLVHNMWPIDMRNNPPDQTWMGDSWEIYSTQALENGTSYRTPIGVDTPGTQFANVDLQIQSLEDNTTVSVDNGTTSVTFNLNRGQTYSSQGYIDNTDATATTRITVNAGTLIQADKPVQAGLVAYQYQSGVGFQDRYYNMIPDIIWGKNYVMPLADNGSDSEIYIYNPNTFPITVNAADTGKTVTFTVPAAATVDYTTAAGSGIPTLSGVRLGSDDVFWAIAAADSNSVTYDWGNTFLPQIFLTDEYYASWAPGNVLLPPRQSTCQNNGNSGGTSLCPNGSPLWVTAVEDNTPVNVDYDNDGTVDENFTLNALEVRMLRDNTDFDQSGTHIWTAGGQKIAVIWGEDPVEAGTSTPNLDVGHLVLPLYQGWLTPVLLFDKTASPEILPPQGGTVAFHLTATSAFFADITSAILTDTLPFSWTYVSGSTTITYPDNTTASFDPTITTQNGQQTLVWNLNKAMAPNQQIQLQFRAAISAANGIGSRHFDGFESNTYNGGSGPWLSDWVEEGTDNADIQIVGNANVTPYSGNYQLQVRDDTRTIYRALDLSGFSQPVLRFKRYFRSLEGGETFGVDISTDNGLSYTPLLTWTTPVSQDVWVQEEVSLTPYITPTARLRFRGISGAANDDYLHLDDIEVFDRLASNTNYGQVAGLYRGHRYLADDRRTVYLSPLKLTLSASAGTASLGSTLVYTLTYENLSSTITGTNVVVQDTLPAGLNFVGASGGGVFDPATRVVSWTVGSVLPGASGSLVFTVTLNSTLPPEDGDLIENAATLASDQMTVRSNSVNVTVSAPDLSVSKSGPGNAAPGDTITYTLTYQNNGSAAATGILITDTLPASTTYVQNSCGSCITLSNASTLQWNLGSVAAGGSGSLSFAVRITDSIAAGSTIQNQARYSHDNLGAARNTNNVATLISRLSLAESANPALVGPGQFITFTLNYANATGGVTQTNTFLYAPIPDFTTYVPGSASAAGGVITPSFSTDGGNTYQPTEPADPATVTHLRWKRGTLRPGDGGSAIFRVQVDDAAALPNSTDITHQSHLTSTESGSVYASTVVVSTVKLSLDKLGPALVAPGDTFTYTLRLGNNGSGDATAVLSDTLPAGVFFVRANPAPASTAPLTWSVSLPANTTNLEYTVVASVPASAATGTELANRATLAAPQQTVSDTILSYVAGAGVTLIPNNSDSGNQADRLCYGHTLYNNTAITDTFNLSVTHSLWAGLGTTFYRDTNANQTYEAGTDTPLTDTNADTITDTGQLVAG